MGHFSGTLKGSAKTLASRVGSVTSGLVGTLSAEAGGAVIVTLYGLAGTDCARIDLVNPAGQTVNVYDGPLDYVLADAPGYLTAG